MTSLDVHSVDTLTVEQYVDRIVEMNRQLLDLSSRIEGGAYRFAWWDVDLLNVMVGVNEGQEAEGNEPFDVRAAMSAFIRKGLTWPNYSMDEQMQIDEEELTETLIELGFVSDDEED